MESFGTIRSHFCPFGTILESYLNNWESLRSIWDHLGPCGSYFGLIENSVLVYQLEVCQEGGETRRGYLKDIEGSWPQSWRTGLFLTLWIMFIYPLGRYPENLVLIYQLEVCQEGVSRRGVLGGNWGCLICKMDERVIPDVMHDALLP